MKTLKFNVARLREQGKVEQTVESYRCEAIADSLRTQDLKVTFTLEAIEDAILMQGKVTGKVHFECCRCLEDFEYPVNYTLSQAYPVTTEEIDIDDEIRQTLILNLPTNPVCREDCQGICQTCGKNRNKEQCSCSSEPAIDQRWGKLQQLIEKKK